MLTREEAKTKVCPIKMTITPAVSYEMLLCNAEGCPKWRDASHQDVWCSHNSNMGEIDNKCPHKFTSFVSVGLGISDNRAVAKNINPVLCNNCPHRYGYCGG